LVCVRHPFESLLRFEAVWHLAHMVLVGAVADRSGRAGCSAATLPRSEPRPIGMSLADPGVLQNQAASFE